MSRTQARDGRVRVRSRPRRTELLRWVPRLGNPVPVVASIVGAAAVVGWQWRDLESLDPRLWMVRDGSALVLIGALYLLDDPSRRSTAAAVTTLRRRVGVRLVALGAVTGSTFLVLVALCSLRGPMGDVFGGLAVEVAGLATVGAAVTLLLARSRDLDEPATAGAMTLLALVALVPLVGMRWPFLVAPGPEWEAAHVRWAVVTGAAALTLVWVTRDPATTLRGLVRLAVSRPVTAGTVSR